MISFPNCKINLGLNVIRKRADGYHDIESVFYPLPLTDIIEAVKSSQEEFITTGLTVNGSIEENLCVRAYRLLQREFPGLPPVKMHLHKVIPMGAGLGGGSANAAFMLKLLNEKFNLQLSIEKLLDYSLQLGSDCPFFIINQPALATGRGEFLQTIPLDLSNYSFVLVQPPIHINTAWAFKQLGTPVEKKSPQEIIQQPIETWKHELVNDFEAPVTEHHPELKSIKPRLYDAGAVYASMSGSGSCFYGIFAKDNVATAFDLPPGWTIYNL